MVGAKAAAGTRAVSGTTRAAARTRNVAKPSQRMTHLIKAATKKYPLSKSPKAVIMKTAKKILDKVKRIKVPVPRLHAEEFVATTGHSVKNYYVHVEKKTLGEIGHGIMKFARGSDIENVMEGDKSSLAPGGGLAAHEAKGGHLIDRHVGKTDEELLGRLKNNPKITGSSIFKDRMTAEKVADTVLRDPKNIEKIQKWITDPNSRPTLPLKFKGDGEIIGRSATRNSEVIENVTNAKIILKKDNNDSFILTGYPVK
ncbi:hypothetical protein HOO54_18615 [Bacillus sp. WMMC1349]|nr:hypothetical protein [Bacillus sp. WMMC1349]